LRPGKGEIKVNNRAFENYFPTESSRAMVRQPLAATETMEKFDLLILADGGGVAGQAGAARLGISRALVEFNAELRSRLKKLGLLTRDPRQHERKKYGQKAHASGSSSPNDRSLPAGAWRLLRLQTVSPCIQAQISLWAVPRIRDKR